MGEVFAVANPSYGMKGCAHPEEEGGRYGQVGVGDHWAGRVPFLVPLNCWQCLLMWPVLARVLAASCEQSGTFIAIGHGVVVDVRQ